MTGGGGYPFPRSATPGANAPGGLAAFERMVLAMGGLLNEDTLHEAMVPFERQDRVLPTGQIHNAALSNTNSVTIPISSFTVPKDQVLMIYDFKPNVFRFSGVDPSDAQPVEPERFSAQMGWLVMNAGLAIGQLSYNLVAQRATTPQSRSQTNRITPFDRAQAQASGYGAGAGAGNSVLPQRPTRVGALNTPYTLAIQPSQTFTASAVIFRPIQTPIAFFQFQYAGFLVPHMLYSRMMEGLKPQPNPPR